MRKSIMDDPALFISIIITMITTSIVHGGESATTSTIQNLKYEDCKKTYMCGNIRVSYPFISSGIPQYCGYPVPEFELEDCEIDDDSHPTITISNHTYIVLKTPTNTLTIARSDSWSVSSSSITSCPSSYFNTSLDFTHFKYTPNDTNITFFYHCDPAYPLPSSMPQNLMVNCDRAGDSVPGYFLTNHTLESNYDVSNWLSNCTSRIVVPAFNKDIENIEESQSLLEVITAFKHGFELGWIAENDKCLDCLNSHGICGSSIDGSENDHGSNTATSTPRFQCHCIDKSYDDKCPTAGGSKSSNSKNTLIGVSVGAVAIAALAILLCACLLFQQRKKKRLQATNAAAAAAGGKNKDMNDSTTPYTFNSRGVLQSINGTTIQSSDGYTTTPTTYSQSASSYLSSRSDLEKVGRDDSSYFGVRLFSYDQLEKATCHFDEARELGDGGFGTVYYGKLTDGCLVAVKRLYENSFKRVEQFMNEVQILARLRHKNLVTLYGCTSRRSRELLLVYEYISNGTVADHIHGKLTTADSTKNNLHHHHLPWLTRLNIAVETAEALAFLHASDVIHRDVKTTNILLDQNFCVKVADFGLCRLFPSDVTHVSTAPQGTPGYVDPEYYQCYRLTEKSDVYSFGVVLIELISSKQAVDITRHRHHINLSNMAVDKIQNHQLNELVDPNLGYENDCCVEKMVKGVAEVAFRCLQQERDVRPTMSEVLDALRAIKKYVGDQDQKVLQEVIVVDKSSNVCKEDDDVELLKNVPPPFSPQ